MNPGGKVFKKKLIMTKHRLCFFTALESFTHVHNRVMSIFSPDESYQIMF